jgi:ribonuclease P protein component
MSNHRFPKALRLLRPVEFERVFAARLSASDTWVVVHGAANQLGHPRLGLTVSRKIGQAATRNRWKRLLRESFRLQQKELPAFDFVCTPRSTVPPRLQTLVKSLSMLASRIERQAKSRQGAGWTGT